MSERIHPVDVTDAVNSTITSLLAERLHELARQLRPGPEARDEEDVADDLDMLANQLKPADVYDAEDIARGAPGTLYRLT